MDTQIATLEREAVNDPSLWERIKQLKLRCGDENGARIANAHAITARLGAPEIEDLEVDWKDDWSNNPTPVLYISRRAENEEYLYEKKGNYYFASVGAFARFFYYSQPGHGYGGGAFNITMQNGEIQRLIGPWSGNSAGAMNAGFPATKEAAVKDRNYKWPRGGCAVLIAHLIPHLKAKGLGLCLMHSGFYEVTSRRKYPSRGPYFNKHGNNNSSDFCRVREEILAPA